MTFLRNAMKKLKKIKILTLLIELILIAVFLYSLWQVVSYFMEGKRESDFNESLIESAVAEVSPEIKYEATTGEDAPISPFEGYEPEASDILYYPDIEVDIKKLKEKYPKVIGWLYCPGTPINYPVLQGDDNQYFVKRLPNGDTNSAGSLFMDYRDSADLSDFIHVIYGHNMKNNSMFGTLLDYRKDGYFREHPYMFYFTEDKTYRLEIFAGVNTVATSDLYSEPAADKRETYLQSVLSKSTFSSNVSVSAEDTVFLMSTCSGAVNQVYRYGIFAKLVEI